MTLMCIHNIVELNRKKKSSVHPGIANCQSSNFQNFLSSTELQHLLCAEDELTPDNLQSY